MPREFFPLWTESHMSSERPRRRSVLTAGPGQGLNNTLSATCPCPSLPCCIPMLGPVTQVIFPPVSLYHTGQGSHAPLRGPFAMPALRRPGVRNTSEFPYAASKPLPRSRGQCEGLWGPHKSLHVFLLGRRSQQQQCNREKINTTCVQGRR